MRPASTILFDLDGTLVDSSEPIIDAVLLLAAETGLPVPTREWARARIGGSPVDTWRLLGAADPEGMVTTYRHRFLADIPARSLAMDGAAETLSALREAGYLLAVATTRHTQSALLTLEATGLAGHVTEVFGGDRVARHKPDPEVIHLALRTLGRPADGALMVGDTSADVGAAHAAGLPCYALLGGIHDEPTLRAAGADIILSGLRELPGALDRGARA